MAAMTALFRDIAVAVEENEAFLRHNFGPVTFIDVDRGLQVWKHTCSFVQPEKARLKMLTQASPGGNKAAFLS